MSAGSNRAIVAALLANMGIAACKLVAFLLTGSSSMLAESIHSVADSGNQFLLLLGGRRSKREASPAHPFGYGSERYIYAFIVAIVLFSLGGLFALYEGWHKIVHPRAITEWAWVPVAVLVSAIALESFSFHTALVEARKIRTAGQSWIDFVRDAKAPELPIVLFEDLGALAGLVLALLGVGLTILTGDGLWDGIGTIAIGVLLVVIAIGLAIKIKSLLVGEGASRENLAAIEQALADEPLVGRIIHMKTLHLGPEELLVAAKISVSGASSAIDVARAIDAAEVRIRAAVPITCVIYLEPDIDRGAVTPDRA